MDLNEATAGWRFVRFLRELLEALPGVTYVEAESIDTGADLIALYKGQKMLVEAKLSTPQTRLRLQEAVEQLQNAAKRSNLTGDPQERPRLVIAFAGVLSPRRQAAVQASGVEVWDGLTLRRMSGEVAVLAPDFLAIPDEEQTSRDWEPVGEFIDRLANIPMGKAGWLAFEQFSEDPLNFLFVPPLNTAITQSSNESRVNRRDIILPNYAGDQTFWGFVRSHYRGDFIVVDAKNYKAPIGKEPVLQLANYLSHHGAGMVGMLFTRNGLAPSGRWTRREQWLFHNKVIVDLAEEDYRQMLLTRKAGGDPAELIRQRIEDFRLQI